MRMYSDRSADGDSIDVSTYAGTDLAVEYGLAGKCWATTVIAGLQFYSYGDEDELIGRVIPAPGDRLQLVREPTNRYDVNAIRVEWRNRFMLGHLPRDVAALVARRLDQGEALRAYVLEPGEGERWSLVALLVGAAAEDLHAQRLEAVAAHARAAAYHEVEVASDAVWGRRRWIRDSDTFCSYPTDVPAPTERQAAAAAAWAKRQQAIHASRGAEAAYAFNLLPPERESVAADADIGAQGATYAWWDGVPVGLRTATAWRRQGRKPCRGAEPYAHIEYGTGRRWRRYGLIAVGDTEPLRDVSPTIRAAAAERAFLAHR